MQGMRWSASLDSVLCKDVGSTVQYRSAAQGVRRARKRISIPMFEAISQA